MRNGIEAGPNFNRNPHESDFYIGKTENPSPATLCDGNTEIVDR